MKKVLFAAALLLAVPANAQLDENPIVEAELPPGTVVCRAEWRFQQTGHVDHGDWQPLESISAIEAAIRERNADYGGEIIHWLVCA